MTRIQEIARSLVAIRNCEKSGNTVWARRHAARLGALMDLMPSGSGLDAGIRLDTDRSTDSRIVLTTSFHHMNDHGMYDGWTDHSVVVTPTFDGFNLRITGKDRNGIKEYLAAIFDEALQATVPTDLI